MTERKAAIEDARKYFIEIGWEAAAEASDKEIVAAVERTLEAIEEMKKMLKLES